MFHKIKSVTALPEYKLSVEFSEGTTKSEDKLIEELKLGEISGEEQGYIGIREREPDAMPGITARVYYIASFSAYVFIVTVSTLLRKIQ